MFYEPSKGHGLPHNPFKALVAPRPIGWIATRSPEGEENLAPYSYFNAVSDSPPIVMFSSMGEKDSMTFARASGCFVAHSVSEAMFDAMNQSSAAYERGTSEIAATRLKTKPAALIDAPVLSDAPSALECKVTQITQPVGVNGEKSHAYLVFGEVVGVHIHDDYVRSDGRFDSDKASFVARGGYLDYSIAQHWIEKPRPSKPE